MAHAPMVRGGSPGAGFGCLGTLVAMVVLAAVVVAVIFIGLFALAIFAALLVIGLLVLAVDRVLLALSPKRRERRANQQGIFMWRSGQVIDTTVIDTTVIDTTATLDEGKDEP